MMFTALSKDNQFLNGSVKIRYNFHNRANIRQIYVLRITAVEGPCMDNASTFLSVPLPQFFWHSWLLVHMVHQPPYVLWRKKYFQKRKQVWRGKKAHNLLVWRWRVLVIQAGESSPLRSLPRCLCVGRKDSCASFGEKHKRKCSELGWKWSRKGSRLFCFWRCWFYSKLARILAFYIKKSALRSRAPKIVWKQRLAHLNHFLNWSNAPVNLISSATSFQLFLNFTRYKDCHGLRCKLPNAYLDFIRASRALAINPLSFPRQIVMCLTIKWVPIWVGSA